MRNFLTCLLPVLLLSGASAQSRSIKIDSKIEQVTVFQNGAQVSRTASENIPAGSHTLVFHRLSQNMDPNSIQLTGSGALTVLSISYKPNFLAEEDQSDEAVKLETELERLTHEIEKTQASMEALVAEKEMILANKQIGGDNGVQLQQLQQTAAFFRKRLEEISFEYLELKDKMKKLEEQRQKLQNQLGQERQRYAQRIGQVVVKVEASAVHTARFELTYQVGNARWESTYDARVTDLKKPVTLIHKARIIQQTGEDWENVNLTLATGNPASGAQVPYMSVWHVGFQNVVRMMDDTESVSMHNQNTLARPGGRAKDESDFANPQFQVTQNLTQQEFTVERKQTLRSGPNPAVVQLRELELPAVYEYHAKPRLDKDAFLIAKIYDWARLNLLSGEVALYNNATYVGKAMLNVENPDDTLQLSLGRDKQVVVKRTRVFSKQDLSFFGNKKIDRYTWKIEVRNNKNTAIKMVLRDQVPVSENEEIEVSIKNVGGGNLEPKSGIIVWRFDLQPAQGREFEVAYEVKYPKDSGGGVRYY